MKNPRYCCLIILAVAMLLLFTACAEGKITVTYVKESAPHISSNAQPSSNTLPEATAKIELPLGTSVEEELTADVNNDGILETIIIGSRESESIDDEDFITLYVAGGSELYKADIADGSYTSAFLTSTDSGKPCLLINITFIDNNAWIFSLNGIQPISRNIISGLVKEVSGADITIEDDTDVLGSWYYTRNFLLSDDFTLKPVSDYLISTDEMEPLHTIKKLPVEMLIEGAYVQQMLNEGIYIYPVSKDDENHLNFRLENGSEGRIIYTFTDNEFYIDGINEYKYFDNIEYWG